MHVAQLRYRRGHHTGQGPADVLNLLRGSSQQEILELSQRQMGDACQRLAIDVVIDPHHRIDLALVIGERMIVQMLQGQTGQNRPGRLALRLVGGGEASMPVAGLAAVGRPEQALEAKEHVVVFEEAAPISMIGWHGRHKNVGQRCERFHEESPGGRRP